jgi:hypothetical protein
MVSAADIGSPHTLQQLIVRSELNRTTGVLPAIGGRSVASQAIATSAFAGRFDGAGA